MNVHYTHRDFGKVSKVLRSCETLEHYRVAQKMIKLLAKKYESKLHRFSPSLGTSTTPFGTAIISMQESCENAINDLTR